MTRNRRVGTVHTVLALLALAVLIKAAHVQLVQGRIWQSLARRQHFTGQELPAPRGQVLDASGRTLVTTREVVRLEVAPREVRVGETGRMRRALRAAGVEPSWVARALDVQRAWVTLPGLYVAEDVAALTAMRGMYTTPVSDRAYTTSAGLRTLLGRVNLTGDGIDGLELTLDSLLRGEGGASRLARDVRGRTFASPTVPGQEPQPGHAVVLTINHELQDIAERSLADAVARMSAEGGDIVIVDPRNGDVLALAGQRRGAAATSVTTVTEPFEPGSTLKPLIAAALLAQGKARTGDKVPARGGTYELHGRTIHDEPHPGPTPTSLSLADVIQLSSNIGIVQFADRLSPREEFEALRDFGIGTPTGFPYSAEAGGTLRPPRMWSRQTPASLAMGYEVSVTPLQLALAYAAIANGGELLEPVLIKEIRAADNTVRYRGARRVVRRVIPEHVARTMRQLLAGVVEHGTAVEADLVTYALAGKTGTPRRTVGGRYAPMQYNPNFVGLFPAEAPQLVIVVKLTNPKGKFYGGSTAAPVTKAVLQAALAARDAALDRSQLVPQPLKVAVTPSQGTRAALAAKGRQVMNVTSALDETVDTTRAEPESSVVLDITSARQSPRPQQAARVVPDVGGLNLREAVRSLHEAGFRVQLTRGTPSVGVTDPAPGTRATPGSLVRLRYDR
ncbi:MAG TPA: penicillin-binding transpeptidase domain-containing protein [Gemmatimonadaceae bacterium]|nr:penicillin-binding transpeptidase domain-containing protein [Gemmatimonadaceae bacterium]